MRLLAASVLVAACVSTPTTAQVFPGWEDPSRTGRVPGSIAWFPTEQGVMDVAARWDPRRTAQGFDIAAVMLRPSGSTQRIVTVDSHTLTLLNLEDGKLQASWTRDMGTAASTQLTVGTDQSTVFAGLTTGDVFAIDPSNGNNPPTWQVAGPPSCVAAGTILAINGSAAAREGLPNEPVVAVAFACPAAHPVVRLIFARNGSTAWQSAPLRNTTVNGGPVRLGNGALTLSVAPSGAALLLVGDDSSGLHALRLASGALAWSTSLNSASRVAVGTPSFDADAGAVWVQTTDRSVYQLDAAGAFRGPVGTNYAAPQPAALAVGWPAAGRPHTAVSVSDRIAVLATSRQPGEYPTRVLTADLPKIIPNPNLRFAAEPAVFGPGGAAAAGAAAGSWAVLVATEGGGLVMAWYDGASRTARGAWAVWLTSSRAQEAGRNNVLAPRFALAADCGASTAPAGGACAVVSLANGSVAVVAQVRLKPQPTPTPPPAGPSPSPAPGGGGLGPGGVAGIVIGSGAGLAAVVAAACFCRRRSAAAAAGPPGASGPYVPM